MLCSSNIITFAIILFMFNNSFVNSMTRDEIKRSSKFIKNTCSAKNNLTEDQVKDVDKGKFIEEKNFMCYIACVHKMGQTLKGNTINFTMLIRQVDLIFPADIKTAVKAAIEHCRGIGKNYTDVCEVSYWTAKCIYEFDPANFIFP